MKVIVVEVNKQGVIVSKVAQLMEESQVEKINKTFKQRDPLKIISQEEMENYPPELFEGLKIKTNKKKENEKI